MEIKRTTEILIETTRRLRIEPTGEGEQIVCGECAELMTTVEAAAVLFGISQRRVFQICEQTGAAHCHETANGVLYICPQTLARILNRKETNV